jgi:hypothetical protein
MGFLKRKNIKKEVSMKKFIVLALALFLAVPAISYAGSATSRWDVTIGGYVKFDMGYSFNASGADYAVAPRDSYGFYENFNAEEGNFLAAAGETRLNFLIKGPDGWGAKTMAFIEGDFRGTTGGSNYGTFALRHAFMKMQWANDSLTIGHTWQKWGLMPSFANTLLAFNMLGAFLKGSRQPQIMWDHNFNKNWGFSFGVISPSNMYGTAGGAQTVNSFTLSGLPFFEGEVFYTSDACGKIGPWQMLFSLSGFYGWEKQTYASAFVTSPGACGPGCVPGRDVRNPVWYDDEDETAWGAAFKMFVPVIPERKGSKAGALSVSGILFTGQNLRWYMGPLAVGAYSRTGLPTDLSYPRTNGGWGQVSYWFTNNFYITGWYGLMQNKVSSAYKQLPGNNNVVTKEYQYIVNLSYDVNPAMRLGLEWDYIKTHYGNYGSPVPGSDGAFYADKKGDLNAIRIGAWYFF